MTRRVNAGPYTATMEEREMIDELASLVPGSEVTQNWDWWTITLPPGTPAERIAELAMRAATMPDLPPLRIMPAKE